MFERQCCLYNNILNTHTFFWAKFCDKTSINIQNKFLTLFMPWITVAGFDDFHFNRKKRGWFGNLLNMSNSVLSLMEFFNFFVRVFYSATKLSNNIIGHNLFSFQIRCKLLLWTISAILVAAHVSSPIWYVKRNIPPSCNTRNKIAKAILYEATLPHGVPFSCIALTR